MFQRIWHAISGFFTKTTLEINNWIPLRRIDPRAKRDNAQQAQMILTNPLFLAVVEALARKYRLGWETAAPHELERQRTAHLQFTALNDLLRELRGHLNSARIMQIDMAARNKREAEKFDLPPEV